MRGWWGRGLVVACVVVMAGGAGLARADDGRGGATRAMPAAGSPPRVFLQHLAKQDSPTSNPAVSGLQVQNLDQLNSAAVTVTVADEAGSATKVKLPPIMAGGSYNVYMPAEFRPPLAMGWYAAAIDGDRRLAAISRTEWFQTGGVAMFSNSIPATDVVLPLVARHYAGQNSVIRIQNTDPALAAEATIRVYAVGQGGLVRTLLRRIPPAGFVTLDMADPGLDFGLLPASFVGWLSAESATPLAVSSYVAYDNGSRAVYGFEGVPSETAADRLYAPLVRNAYYGTTGISIVNPLTTPTRVTVRFTGSLGSCVGQSFTQGPVMVAAGSSAVFYQANVNVPGSGTSPLPAGCAGSATIEAAAGKVLAVVNDASGNAAQPTSAAAYNAVSAAQAAKRVALPLYRNRHTKAQLTTGIQAMNVGDVAARVEITFALNDGALISGAACGGACQAIIAPGAAQLWFPAGIPALPANKYGSALIASDQPLAVIVNDASLTGAMDAGIYNGINADEPSPDAP
jgi:hypothetical protein